MLNTIAARSNNMSSELIITVLLSITVRAIAGSLLFSTRREIKRSPENPTSNFTELTGQYGYISEEHKVITEDGYILTIFRIVKAKNCHGKKRIPPVLLMHGLLLSSDSWIDSGPTSGLAYLIADACYDIWVGNCRGNYYSRSHIYLNPDKDPAFWQFYIDEIGKFDVPAMIDYVLDYTRAKALNYIGFSQGAGTLFVMCSERPGYCDKVQLMIALAPSSRHVNTQSFIFRTLTDSLAQLEDLFAKFGMIEVFAQGATTHQSLELFCRFSMKICDGLLQLYDHVKDFHYGSITNETIRNLFTHFPAGTSLRNMVRYGQSMRSPRFERFDYGRHNLMMYGSETPPEYNLGVVTAPVLCIYGKNDGIVDDKDVKWLMSKLPNVIEVFEVENPLWNHVDVPYSQHTNKYIFPKIDEYLYRFTQT